MFGLQPGRELVVTVDALVEGVHFLPDDPPDLVARKALRVNLSDLAAMAADPLAYSLVTALPRSRPDSWLEAFAAGLAADQEEFGIALLGGDSVSTPGPATFSITALGTVPSGQALARDAGRAGDLVFVTGTLGDAALGLGVATGQLSGLAEEHALFLADRYRLPRPRTPLGPMLRGIASAGLDVSDGLIADLGHLCEESGLAAVIEVERLPLSGAARAGLSLRPDLASLPLAGGDDYELVLAVPPGRADALRGAAATAGVALTEIGRLVAGTPGEVGVLDAAGQSVEVPARGWQHF